MKSLLFPLSFLFLWSSFAHNVSLETQSFSPIKQDMLVELSVPVTDLKRSVSRLRSKSYDLTYVNNKTGTIHLLINQNDFSLLKSEFPQLAIKSSRYVSTSPDSQYKTYDEIRLVIENLKAKFPELVHVSKIGTSLEGRDIIAVRISDDENFNVSEPSVLFNALHHAREVMTVEIIQDILESLTQGYAKSQDIHAWVEKLQIWIVPMVNPDGSNKVWTSDAMWRKNTRNNHGVDINRNYPFKWGECNGSSSSTWAQDYRGSSAGSEPETQTMMGFIEKIKPLYSISYHSYGEMVIHPYGCNGALPDPVDQVVETAKQLGGLIKHTVGAAWQILYDVDGGDIDWMYGVHHVLPFVIEVSTKNDGFQPSYSRRAPVVDQNKAGWKFLLAKASGVGMPTIPNQQPQTRPSVMNWGGRWYEMSSQRYKMSKRSFVMTNQFNRSRVLAYGKMGGFRKIIEHPIVPSKSSQHYQLPIGHYRLEIVGPTGHVIDSRDFEVTAGTEAQITI